MRLPLLLCRDVFLWTMCRMLCGTAWTRDSLMGLQWFPKSKYSPPNPHPAAFASAGGADLWDAVMDIRDRVIRLETRQQLLYGIMIVLLGGLLAATLAKLFV